MINVNSFFQRERVAINRFVLKKHEKCLTLFRIEIMSKNSTLRNIISKYNLKKLTEKGHFIYNIYNNAVLK